MFIVWGRKAVVTRLGWVADYCPLCRSIRQFELQRVGSASHVYYVSFGKGDLVGHQRRCVVCDTICHAEPQTYAAIGKVDGIPLNELQANTFPNIDTERGSQIALAQRLKTSPGSFTAAERQQLINSSIGLFAQKVETRFAQTQLDLPTGLALAGAGLLFAVLFPLLNQVWPDQEPVIATLCGLAAVALVVWQFVAAGRRFMMNQVAKPVAQALLALQPTKSEWQQALSDFKAHGYRIGRRLKVNDLILASEVRAPGAQ